MKIHQSNTGKDTQAGADLDAIARLLNPRAGSSLILVCEHASKHIPEHFSGLGLSPELQESHIAWDPGALAVAEDLSRRLDARLVVSLVSRLVYDCNRPPDAPDAVPTHSEIFEVPGNAGLSESERADRARTYYLPFDSLLSRSLAQMPHEPVQPVLVTVHSFTPVYRGQHRTTEIGILHDSDTRLADALLEIAPRYSPLTFRRNDPYGPADGVTHTLKRHGIANSLLNVMLEIRNDLLREESQQQEIAAMLAGLLQQALASLLPEAPTVAPASGNRGPECHL